MWTRYSITGAVTVAALFDTSVAILHLRRRPPVEAAELLRVARSEIDAGSALLPVTALSELLIGEGTEPGLDALRTALSRLPVVILPTEAATHAGLMGAFLRDRGAAVPLPDLLIAATAVWLDVPLLAWDGDYARARDIARRSRSPHEGAGLWKQLDLHAASLNA